MDEEEKTKETTEETTDADSDTGDKPKIPKAIELANEAAKRMEDAKEAMRIENDRREELAAHRQLDGTAEAGASSQKPKEETPSEYMEKVLSGALNKKDD